jgi:hypothetical protein
MALRRFFVEGLIDFGRVPHKVYLFNGGQTDLQALGGLGEGRTRRGVGAAERAPSSFVELPHVDVRAS